MICYNCGYHLQFEHIKECPLCGMKFPINCHACGSPNPLYATYCFHCGNEIKKDKQSSVQNFDTLAETRKNVAVMFADVSGFTALSEKMDPEEVREIINDVFQYITKPVYELEGMIDKYIGDCVMILFGAKQSHSDDPKRALTCGMEMMKRMEEFSKERLSRQGLNLNLTIGINYGLVVTGSVGNYFDKDYTVMGDIVNTAQRLQTSATKGTILVSESVYNETKDEVEYGDSMELQVKNKEKPIKAYSPVRLKTSISFGPMFLIERDNEIATLQSLYHTAKKPAFVTIVGEGGIGKTSLIKRFVSDIDQQVKKIWISCNPIYQNRVYYVLSNLLFSMMNINAEDSNRVKENRLRSYIDFILKEYDFQDEDIKRMYDFLSLVMGLDRSNEFQAILNAMNYQDLQRELVKQITLFFTHQLKKQQHVIIVDDIQWADLSSIYILKELMKLLPEVRSMFIFASRYEVEAFLNMEVQPHIIKLQKLDSSGVHSLGCKLMGSKAIDSNLLETMMKYTGGNPLYVKEFVTAVKRKPSFTVINGVASIKTSEIGALPTTIENLILDNLVELKDIEKQFIQIASVMGKEFHLSWVMLLLDTAVDEMEILELLLKMDLISLKTVHTTAGTMDKIYTFNQDTIREVIYNSILNRRKMEWHRQTAEWIESKYTKQLEHYYEALCIHYENAGMVKKAMEYYYKTAVKNKSDFNLESAIRYYKRFLDIAPHESHDQRIVQAYMDLGNIYMMLDQYDTALQYLDQAMQQAEFSDHQYEIQMMQANIYKEKGTYTDALSILDKIEPKLRRSSSLYGRLLQQKCSILAITGNKEALNLAKQSEEILLKLKDYENLAETMSQTGIIYFTNGEIENGLYYMEKAYQYAEKVNNLRALDRVAGNLGIMYHVTGMVSKAFEFINISLNVSKKISNLQGMITNNINLGIIFMEKGLFNESEKWFKLSLNHSNEISSVFYKCTTLYNLGEMLYERGNYKEAFNYYNFSIKIARSHNLTTEEGINYLGLVKLNLKLNNFKVVPSLMEDAAKLLRRSNYTLGLIDYYRYKSMYELNQYHIEQALKSCEQSIRIAEDARNDMKKLKALRLKGNIFAEGKQIEKALSFYEESIHLAEQLESDYEAAKGYFRKYQLLKRWGYDQKAAEQLAKSREAISKTDPSRWKKIIEEA